MRGGNDIIFHKCLTKIPNNTIKRANFLGFLLSILKIFVLAEVGHVADDVISLFD